MIEISVFGVLAGTLASALSLVLLLVALGAVAYLGLTAITAALRLGPGQRAVSSAGTALRTLGRRWSPRTGVAASLATLGFGLAGLRLHDAGSNTGSWLFTAAVALTASTATGAWCAALCLAGWRSLATLADRSAEQRLQIEGARHAAVRAVEAKSALFLAGDDLRSEVEQAETALAQLGGALAALEEIGAGLRAKLASAEVRQGGAGLVAEHAELEDDVARKVELGRRIQTEAEIAVFRLRCHEPLRRLVRRRPREATAGLGSAAASRDALRAAAGQALPAVERFLGEAHHTREALSGLEGLRPSHLDPADPDDPLARARREVAAIEAAYAAVLRRVEVVVLRLDADAGLREVASAAGALSPSARIAGLDETELDQLIEEVARADTALSIGLPGDVEARTVSEALARSTAALTRNDGRSLDELVRAMREIE
jgi:hypothetical protein